MKSCYSCGKKQPTNIKFKVVCSDCCVSMCDHCKDDEEVRCGCYGKCDRCGCDVNRGEDGWRSMDTHEWLCYDCKNKSESIDDHTSQENEQSDNDEDPEIEMQQLIQRCNDLIEKYTKKNE